MTPNELGNNSARSEPHIAPLERFIAPPGLGGEGHTRGLRNSNCLISAKNDLEAISAWLTEVTAVETSYLSYRRAVERLLNWTCFQRRIAFSSLQIDDLVLFGSFLNFPSPSEQWICAVGTRRESEDWRPFNRPLGAGSQEHTFAILASLFKWLGSVNYAQMPPISTLRALRSGFGQQSKPATRCRRRKNSPLSLDAWRWIERLVASDPLTVEIRLGLELLYFGGLHIEDLKTLRDSQCIPPNIDFPTWRIFLADPPSDIFPLYVLPPLNSSLDEWFFNRESKMRQNFDVSQVTLLESNRMFSNVDAILIKIRKLLREAGSLALARGDMLAGAELSAATPYSFRYAIEIHGENDKAFQRGFIARSRWHNSLIGAYARNIEFDLSEILQGWVRLEHLWRDYPAAN